MYPRDCIGGRRISVLPERYDPDTFRPTHGPRLLLGTLPTEYPGSERSVGHPASTQELNVGSQKFPRKVHRVGSNSSPPEVQ